MFLTVSSVKPGEAIAAADSLVRKIMSGITNGKPSTAIKVALLPARDAIALMVVNKKE